MDIKKIDGIETRFLDALQRTYQAYVTHGARSPEKLRVLHGWIKQELQNILGAEYRIISLSMNEPVFRPEPVNGMYYNKRVNISVSRGDSVVGIINVSFVSSNFRQNAGNYFENQLGETANLRSNNIVFGRLFCLTDPIPYYMEDGSLKKLEAIEDRDIEKYNRLANDPTQLHAPDVLGICVAKVDLASRVVTGWATEQDLQEVDVDNYKIISDEMDIETFFTNFVLKTEAKYNEVHKWGWFKKSLNYLKKVFICIMNIKK